MLNEHIIKQYSEFSPIGGQVIELLEKRLKDALPSENYQIHSINSRFKQLKSFKQKIARPDRTFDCLWDVTDLLGLRVITYFEDTIEDIASVIEKEFNIDYKNSEDKLHHNDSDRFGYRSLHYVCYVPTSYGLNNPNARFEIQIRTVLQHAWAEIEHDLGYKATDKIPAPIRRRFSQVASLLEVADREFVSIRDDLSQYEQSLNIDEDKNLNIISLKKMIHHSTIHHLDETLAGHFERNLTEAIFYPDYLVKALHNAGIENSETLIKIAENYKPRLLNFAKAYFKFTYKQWQFDTRSLNEIQSGYSVLFIAHMHVLEKRKLILDKLLPLTNFYLKTDYPQSKALAEQVARSLIETLVESDYFES
jgi:putative GTP pyrophosphokinase